MLTFCTMRKPAHSLFTLHATRLCNKFNKSRFLYIPTKTAQNKKIADQTKKFPDFKSDYQTHAYAQYLIDLETKQTQRAQELDKKTLRDFRIAVALLVAIFAGSIGYSSKKKEDSCKETSS